MNHTGDRALLLVGGHPLVLQDEVTNQVRQKRMHLLPFSKFSNLFA
jgi:hypothetical protein